MPGEQKQAIEESTAEGSTRSWLASREREMEIEREQSEHGRKGKDHEVIP